MPYVSKAQQRFMESDASPLSAKQKEEWRSKTNFKDLPDKIAKKMMGRKKDKHGR